MNCNMNIQGSGDVDLFTEYGEGNQYRIEEVIGKGSYGVVCSAYDIHLRKNVANKKINDIFEHVSDVTCILHEIKLLLHPDIVKIWHRLLPLSRRKFMDIYVVFEIFRLAPAELLTMEDKELNQYVPLKKIATYREKEWKVSRMKMLQLKDVPISNKKQSLIIRKKWKVSQMIGKRNKRNLPETHANNPREVGKVRYKLSIICLHQGLRHIQLTHQGQTTKRSSSQLMGKQFCITGSLLFSKWFV